MFAAFVVYFTLLVSFVFFSRYRYLSKSGLGKKVLGYCIPILIACILLGGRYKTGSDWENYKEFYDSCVAYKSTINNIFDTSYEPLYALFNIIIAYFGVGSSVFFSCVAIIQFSVVYLVFRERPKVLPCAMFFYTLGNLTMDINIIRQSIAMSAILLSFKYLSDKRIFSLLLLLIAVGFHYSAIVFLPVIFLSSNIFNKLDNFYIAVVLYFVSVVFAPIFNQYLSGYIQMLDFGAKYSRTAEILDLEMELSSGYGIIARHFLNILLLFLWCRMGLSKVDMFHKIAYRIVVVGICLANIFGISLFLSRMSVYYTQFTFILWALLIYAIFNITRFRKYEIFGIGVIALSLAIFVFAILNSNGGCSPYYFRWIG